MPPKYEKGKDNVQTIKIVSTDNDLEYILEKQFASKV